MIMQPYYTMKRGEVSSKKYKFLDNKARPPFFGGLEGCPISE